MPEKLTFDYILKIIQQIDRVAGISFIKKNPKQTFLDKYFSLQLPIHGIVLSVLSISTLYIKNCALINVIIIFCITIITCGYFTLYLEIREKKLWCLHDLINWCKNLYNIEDKFDESIHDIAKDLVIKMKKTSILLLKLMRNLAYIDAIAFTCGTAIIGLLLPDNIYGHFAYPIPFYLPFRDQNTWFAWISTLIAQTIAAITMFQLGIFFFGTIFVFATHIFYYLRIIKETVEVMKTEMSSINIKKNINNFDFDKWTKVLTDMICDASDQVSKFNNLYTTYFFFLEIGSLATYFTCGLIFIVVKDQYVFAVGITIGNALLFLVCYINEKLLEGFEEIQESLYDTPWYNLSVKQMKVMSILLHCDKIQLGCNALKLNDLTFDRFAILMKAGYTNLLVLRDLVQNNPKMRCHTFF